MTTFGLYLDCYGKAYFERHMILTMSKNFRGYYKNFSPPCVSVWSILKNKCFSCYNLPNTVVVTVVVCLVAATKCRYVSRLSCVANRCFSCNMQKIVNICQLERKP